MKKVTENEITQLHQFVQSRFVEFYDVELELVDHLANGIEAQWQENPNLSFEEAKQMEFKKFGIFGFTGVVERKETELTSIYIKDLIIHLKIFFSFPKIVFSLAVFLVLFALGYKGGEIGQSILVYMLLTLFVAYIGVGMHWNYSIKKTRKKEHKYILDSIAIKVFFGGIVMPLIIQTPNFISFSARHYSVVSLVVLSLLILLLGLWSYITIFIFKPYFSQEMIRYKQRYIA